MNLEHATQHQNANFCDRILEEIDRALYVPLMKINIFQVDKRKAYFSTHCHYFLIKFTFYVAINMRAVMKKPNNA